MLLTLVAGFALWWGLWPAGSLHGLRIRARFEDVTGLPRDGMVQLGGVPVGRVVSLAWREGAAEVTMVVDRRISLPRDTEAVLRPRSLLGERFIDLRPGRRQDVFLREGDRLERTRRAPDLEALLAALPADRLDDAAVGTVETIEAARRLLRRLEGTLDRADRALGAVERLAEEARRDVGEVRRVATEVGPDLELTLQDAGRLARTVDRVLDRDVAPLLQGGQRTVKRLDALALKLEGTLLRLDPVLVQAREVVDRDYLHHLLREEGVRVHVAPFR